MAAGNTMTYWFQLSSNAGTQCRNVLQLQSSNKKSKNPISQDPQQSYSYLSGQGLLSLHLVSSKGAACAQ